MLTDAKEIYHGCLSMKPSLSEGRDCVQSSLPEDQCLGATGPVTNEVTSFLWERRSYPNAIRFCRSAAASMRRDYSRDRDGWNLSGCAFSQLGRPRLPDGNRSAYCTSTKVKRIFSVI
jgi:hypothetical protein